MNSQRIENKTLRLLWGLAVPGARGPQPRFTVEEVTAAACVLADDEGLAPLTLAKVAGALGLTTTALYRYVESKEALVELMTDQAVGTPPDFDGGTLPDRAGHPADRDGGNPASGTGWEQDAQAWTRALWQRYLDHRWLAVVQVGGMPAHPNRLAWMNSLLLVLDRGNVTDPLHIALLLDSLARAFAALSPQPGAPVQETPDWLPGAIAARFPRVAAELGRDWTDVEHELSKAVATVLGAAR